MQAKKDIQAGVVLLLFSIILYFVLIPNFVESEGGLSGLSPQFFPNLSAIALGLFSAALIVLKIIELIKSRTQKRKKDDRPNDDTMDNQLPQDRFRPYLAAAILSGYFFLFDKLGFLIATPICLTALMLLFGLRKIFTIIITCVVVTTTLFVLFEYGLKVPLG